MDTLIIAVISIIVALILLFYFIPIGLYSKALATGIKIDTIDLVKMRIQKISPKIILTNLIKAAITGVIINKDELEAHYLAGGNVNTSVDAMISAKLKGTALTFFQASQADLAVIKNAKAEEKKV